MRTCFLLPITCVALTSSFASASPNEEKSQLLTRDNRENIARTFEQPDGLPDRQVADLAEGSICFDGGMQCLSVNAQDPAAIAFSLQDRSQKKTSPDAVSSIAIKSNFDENTAIRMWNTYIVRENRQSTDGPRYIVGIVATVTEAYSGGGAMSSVLYLYDLQGVDTKYPTAREILSLPFDGEKTIRACFSEKTAQQRKGACHDTYIFTGRITLAPTTQDAWPVLNYTAEADVYPRGIDLNTDNSARILTRADLVSETDTDCTFSRQAHYNPLTARYEFAESGPDCRQYFVRYGE